MPTEKLYTINELAKRFNQSPSAMYRYKYNGLIETYTVNQHGVIHHLITDNERKRIQKMLYIPKSSMTMQAIVKKYDVSYSVLRYFILKHDIKPVNQYGTPHYALSTVKKLLLLVVRARQAKQRTVFLGKLKKAPHVSRDFNPDTDYTPCTIGKFLAPKKVSYRSVINWAIKNRVEYSLDRHQRIYFNPRQARLIKARFRVIPADIDCTQCQLAKRLGIANKELDAFRRFYQIKGQHILGYREIHFSYQETELITKYWQDPKARPYQYQKYNK